MRLQTERPPDLAYARVAHSGLRGHLARAPVSSTLRSGLKCLHDDPLDVLVRVLTRGADTWLIVEAVEALLDEATSPLADSLICRPVRVGDRRTGGTSRAGPHQLGPERGPPV